MREAFAVCAAVAVVLAQVLVVAHLVGLAVLVRRRVEARPELVPWGYVGGGLAVSAAGFLLVRLLADGSPGVADLTGLLVVLAVCSWGFGAAYEWATVRFARRVRWPVPLACAAVTGVLLGAAAPTLGV